eukprot:Seg1647.13 transcript_id=Seg1647.13/GoldUCD/mRNA.D3Y31 product="Glycoprotein-associated amino acid transporter b0,+AT1" protein_id=Seg1647.13/GoldUCD/D3Y31
MAAKETIESAAPSGSNVSDTHQMQDITQRSLGSQPYTIDEISNEVDINVIPSAEIGQGKELRKKIGPVYAIAYVIGILIGSGIFVSPALIARQTSNMGTALIVWIVTAIPCIWGAFCLCELACMLRKAGGPYLYILEAYGECAAFVVSWSKLIIIVPAAIATIAVSIGQHISEPFYDVNTDNGAWLAKAIAICFVLVSFIINCFSNTFVGRSQVFFTSVQALSVIFLVALGIYKASFGNFENYIVMFKGTGNVDIGNFGLALYNGLWAYEGWAQLSNVSEELTNLERDLWLSIVIGLPFVMVCYVMINLALISALTHDQIANSPTVTSLFVETVLGKKASFVIPFAAAATCFGCINAALFLFARSILSAAREGHLPNFICFIHEKRRTPVVALFILTLNATIWILAAGANIQQLLTYFSFAMWVEYTLAIFAVIVFRIKRPNAARPFKVWLANPIITTIIALFLVFVPFIRSPIESTVCLLIIMTGLPIYFVFVKKQNKLPRCVPSLLKSIEGGLHRYLNVVPCVYKEEARDIDANK